MAGPDLERMSRALRWSLFLVFGALWASGCVWLALHLWLARPGELGTLENPWQPTVLELHGCLAVASIFLLGWVGARHASARWPRMTKRGSGISVATVAAVLVLSGYALYYTTDRLHEMAQSVHEVVGCAAIGFALVHWRRYRRRRVRRMSLA